MKSREERAAYLRAYRLRNIDKHREQDRERKKKYAKKFPWRIKQYKERYSEKHREEIAARTRAWKANLRRQVLDAYGRQCSCCGEARERFLTIEHINGGGSKHARDARAGVYCDLRDWGFPKDGYTLLCWNCNCATKDGLICPHREVALNVA